MEKANWMLYGATGFTGQLIVEEALRRGHRPLLAGRSAKKLQPLADKHGMDWVAVSLEDRERLEQGLRRVKLVLNAAGPFVDTALLMQEACLRAGVHYVDITGEVPVFRQIFAFDQEARRRGIVLISGAGFDVVPSDCLAKYVSERLPGAVELEIAITSLGSTSAGTQKSSLGMVGVGGLVRREGELRPWKLGEGAKTFRFSDRERLALPIPWGDLVTAYHSTGIPNITTYMAFPPSLIRRMRLGGGLVQSLLSFTPAKILAGKLIDGFVKGPDEETRKTGRSYFYACARDRQGRSEQAWLEAGEAYSLTAAAGVGIVEKLLEEPKAGSLSPAQAFGADFVLEIENTRRFEQIEK